MGNTCKPMAVSFQCMTKSTTNKKKKTSSDQKLEKKFQEVPETKLKFATHGQLLIFIWHLHCIYYYLQNICIVLYLNNLEII